jgi:hypothetical protein
MPTRLPRVSCSVVCYRNEPAQVARTLASVVAAGIEIALYLVDNSPQDALAWRWCTQELTAKIPLPRWVMRSGLCNGRS